MMRENTYSGSDILSEYFSRNYVEKIGPADLLNPNIKHQWTLNRCPDFTGIIHTDFDLPITKVIANIDDERKGEAIVQGNRISYNPGFDLPFGSHHVYLSIQFEKDNIIAASWSFTILKSPPSISGFLGSSEKRKYYLCFDHEIDKTRLEDKAYWAVNGDQTLIKEIKFLNIGNWVEVTLASAEEKESFRDDDYHISFDTGSGIVSRLLIPEKIEMDSPGGGGKSGCGSIEHDPEEDIHQAVESESHAIAYKVTRPPDCELDALYTINMKTYYNHQKAPLTRLGQDVNDPNADGVANHVSLGSVFALNSGWHTLFFPYTDDIQLQVDVINPGSPPVTIWHSPYWRFNADLTAPRFELKPVVMHGAEAADFLERHYWYKAAGVTYEPGQPFPNPPDRIQNACTLLRSELMSCEKFILVGTLDDHRAGGHNYIWVDIGPSPDLPPTDTWANNDSDLLNSCCWIDVDPEYCEENIHWHDPAYDPYDCDGFWEGEYKVWFIPYSILDNYPENYIMRPRYLDTASNWRREDDIRHLDIDGTCDDFVVKFLKPSSGNMKKYINLQIGETLPENIPDEQRGRNLPVKVKIYNKSVSQPHGIPDFFFVALSWIDPQIDRSVLDTKNPPGYVDRQIFPWLTDSPIAGKCAGQNVEVWPWDNLPGIRFPNPETPPSGCLPANYPHVDNSYPCFNNPISPKSFSDLGDAYGYTLTYQKPGYGSDQEYIYYAFPELCETTFETEFWTSNFGGDNYILTAQLTLGFPCTPSVTHEGTITVWRKAYVSLPYMASYPNPPRPVPPEPNNPKYLTPEGDTKPYTHYDGPYYVYWDLQYFRRAFDDGFIEIQEVESDSWTQYQDIIADEQALSQYLHTYACNNDPHLIPHCYQFFDCDHLGHHPYSYANRLLGSTCLPDENHHSAIAYGSIRDIFSEELDTERIDGFETFDSVKISGNIATHEMGHSMILHKIADQKSTGHMSGPGIMWAPWDTATCPINSRKNGKRTSYFWGDHIFLMRIIPEL
jgi:hypothetical protein